jgi:hypothetical protein
MQQTLAFERRPIPMRTTLAATMSLLVMISVVPAIAAAPDPVLEWNAIMNDTLIAAKTSPLFTSRQVALVAASVFDAVNGIEPRYEPIHVRPDAPPHASVRAAAIQAAFAALVKLYPAFALSLAARRDTSIAAIAAADSPQSIQAGMAWGQAAADAIAAWRATDGFSPPPPPFVGVLGLVTAPVALSVWRPTPLANGAAGLPGAGPQFASMTPWVLRRPSQFRLPAPPALTSAEYAADVNETKTMGAFSGSPRTADQSEFALFWNGNTALFWNRIASQISSARFLTVAENAHLFALLNVAMADAGIACWDSKYRYVFWRPITAIREADADGNAATDADPLWTPWLDFFALGTPAFPEYPSGHSTVSGAAAFILTRFFGDATSFTVGSDVRPGTRSFPSFSAAVAEVADARVFGGIHFRTACVRGNALGRAVAAFVSTHAMRPENGDRDDDRR